VHHPESRAYLSAILRRFADSGVAMVRLDAIGYAVKTPGSSCFLTPETDEFVDQLAAEAHALGLGVLTEVHAPHRYAVELAGRVDRVYDFALAPLILRALLAGDDAPLRRWLATRPHNAVTVLETHDGIAMVDAGPDFFTDGRSLLLSAGDLFDLATRISRNSDGTAVNVETPSGGLYRVDCTIYDALARDDRRYLLARLIQFLTPGIPQVYYVGLLAGHNTDPPTDADSREINRRRYTAAQVRQALGQPVVQALLRLIRFRNRHPAFAGDFALPDAPPGRLAMSWRAGAEQVHLTADLTAATYTLAWTDGGAEHTTTDVAGLPD
jgi:sucrose phosphorylase